MKYWPLLWGNLKRRKARTFFTLLSIVIAFPAGEVREFAGEPHNYWFKINRRLVETVAAERAVDWRDSPCLSARFRACRSAPFHDFVDNKLLLHVNP